MWYRFAKNILAQGFGGGAIAGGGKNISPTTDSPVQNSPLNQNVPAQNAGTLPKAWDALVNQNFQIDTDNHTGGAEGEKKGPATMGTEFRRMSPDHSNPEMTTINEQLETVRQHNLNAEDSPVSDQSMASTEDTRGSQLIRGVEQNNQGKSADLFQDKRPSTYTLM